MPAFFLSFVACLLVTMAGREQLRVARLASVLGPRAGLVVAVGISSVATCGMAAWAGGLLANMLTDYARQIVVAIALLLAALQIALLRAKPAPKEPTWSFGAILIVLLVAQIADAARLAMVALAIQTGEAVSVAAGGALGSGLALLIASLKGAQWEQKMPCDALSRTVGGMLMLTALFIGISS